MSPESAGAGGQPLTDSDTDEAAAPVRSRREFLTADWRYLVMLNYEIDPRVLAALVPAGTELDLWEGRALVSAVGFRFLDTRLFGMPIPFHRHFDEVNLRFYVRRRLPSGSMRRGVVFVRELVPRLAIAVLARLIYNEPYRALVMRSEAPATPVDSPGRLTYAWRLGGTWQHLAATARGTPAMAAPSSEAAFITEHHWGYTRQRDGGTIEYEVAHRPWRLWAAEDPELAADVTRLYGRAFAPALSAAPGSALVAEGSPVTVFAPRRLTS